MEKTLRNTYIDALTNLKKSNYFLANVPELIVDVIYNGPATIVFWSDGSKTVVKCTETDEFDWEKGLAMAISKHYLGKNFKKNFKFYQPKDEKKKRRVLIMFREAFKVGFGVTIGMYVAAKLISKLDNTTFNITIEK